MLKNNQNTHYPRFSFISKTGIAFPKTGVLFLVWLQQTWTVLMRSKTSGMARWKCLELKRFRSVRSQKQKVNIDLI